MRNPLTVGSEQSKHRCPASHKTGTGRLEGGKIVHLADLSAPEAGPHFFQVLNVTGPSIIEHGLL